MIHEISGDNFKSILSKIIIILLFGQLTFFGLSSNIESSEALSNSYDTKSDEITINSVNGRSSSSELDTWTMRGLWTDNEELNAVAVGDVDHTHHGDEIVVAGNSNKVTVVYGFGSIWVAEEVYTDDWWITAVAIGDVYPAHPGNEIVIVGWSTKVTLIYKSVETDKWISEVLFQDTDWLYDVAIGDLDPTHEGNEIVWSGDPRILRMLSFSEDTQSWTTKNIWGSPSSLTPADINVITIGDFNATHPGNECAVAGVLVNKINLTEVFYNDSTGKWNVHDMGKLEKDPLEMVAGDFYAGHPGDELALVSIQRNVMMIYQDLENDNWIKEKLWQDTESIRDIEIMDIFSDRAGNELVVVGYSNSATVVMQPSEDSQNNDWEYQTIFHGSSNLNGIAAGEFNAFHSGPEIALLQSTGKVLKLQNIVNDFNMFTPQNVYSVPAGNSITVPIVLIKDGSFSEPVNLSVKNADAFSAQGIVASFNQSEFVPPTLVEVRFDVSNETVRGDYDISILGTSQSSTQQVYLNFTLTILPENTPAFNVSVLPKFSSVVADFSTDFGIFSERINSWSDTISYNFRYLPVGMSISIKYPVDAPSRPLLTVTTTSATSHERFFIIMTGTGAKNHSYQHSTVIVLDVLSPSPDYTLSAVPADVFLNINASAELIIHGFSLFGFNEPISFNFSGLPGGIDIWLQPETFIPTGNSSVTIHSTQAIEIKEYNITISGTAQNSGLKYTTFFRLHINPEPQSFKLDINRSEAFIVYEKETAEIELIITPVADFSGEVNITVSGLKGTMTWNSKISPVLINSEERVTINLSGLNNSDKYDLTITVYNRNLSKDINLTLDVLPEIPTDSNGEEDTDIIQLILLIVALIIILIFVYRITKRAPPTVPDRRQRIEDDKKIDEVEKQNKNPDEN
jgi:hypothetical protein